MLVAQLDINYQHVVARCISIYQSLRTEASLCTHSTVPQHVPAAP